MPVLRLFAAAREAAGVARVDIDGATVAEMLDVARTRYGERFVDVLGHSRIWVNGQPAEVETPVTGRDVVAVIPPVSGGAGTGIAERPAATPPPPPAPPPPRSISPPPPPARPSAETGDRPVAARAPGPRSGGAARAPGPRSGGAARAPGPPPAAGLGGGTSVTVARGAPGPRSEGAARAPGPRSEGVRRSAEAAPGNGEAARRVPPATDSRPVLHHTTARELIGDDRPPRREAEARMARPAVERAATTVDEPNAAATPSPPEAAVQAARTLAVKFTTTRPHGRLGILWIILMVGATLAGVEFLAVLLGVTVLVGACQATAARRARGEHTMAALASAMALALAASAGWGLQPLLVTAAATTGLVLLVWLLFPSKATPRDIGFTLAIGAALGTAAASTLLLRELRLDATLLMLAFAAAYDSGAYLVGTGASNAWEGPAAGVMAMIPVTILAAVVLVPPFPAGGPFLLGLLAAVLTPMGPLLGTALVGSPDADVPGLRRLDSLFFLAPVWAAAAWALL